MSFKQSSIRQPSFPFNWEFFVHICIKFVQERFPQHPLRAVSTLIFLRFLNPDLALPHQFGIVDAEPLPRIKRGLTFVSKSLQNIANHLLFFICEISMIIFVPLSISRRAFDKMATLLAYLGPPDQRPLDSQWIAYDMTATKFEELVAKRQMHEREEFQSLNILYQAGFSKQNNTPVF